MKQAGPSWAVLEKKGRKTFSKGLWAPSENIEAARRSIDADRSTESYARRRELEVARRETRQADYVVEFETEVRKFLRFSSVFGDVERELAKRVAAHATPVGSGTVARTKRIPVGERAEAAVIAWMRHQTTAYDQLKIPRVAGKRREVRRELAEISRLLLDLHRRPLDHEPDTCPLCDALEAAPHE